MWLKLSQICENYYDFGQELNKIEDFTFLILIKFNQHDPLLNKITTLAILFDPFLDVFTIKMSHTVWMIELPNLFSALHLGIFNLKLRYQI